MISAKKSKKNIKRYKSMILAKNSKKKILLKEKWLIKDKI